MLDLQLPGGARMNVIIPPASRENVLVTIRNHTTDVRSLEDLVAGGVLSRSAATFLAACVSAGLNILIAGATGSGKTTLLNCLGARINPQERVIIIEETSELNFPIRDCLYLQARNANIEGLGEITLGDLVRNALRMRPTWLIVGEVRGGEAMDMLKAMSTGHSSATSIHSNSATEAFTALKTCAMQAPGRPGPEVVVELIRQAIDIVVHLVVVKRSNRRYVSSILEVTPGGEGLQISSNEIFKVRFREGRKDRPYLTWSGLVPRCLPRLEEVGLDWRGQILAEEEEENLEEGGAQ
jgi:pilus assembly protein CpaF